LVAATFRLRVFIEYSIHLLCDVKRSLKPAATCGISLKINVSTQIIFEITMPMIKLLLKSIAKFFGNLIHSTIVAILLGIVGLPVLISWATGTLDFLLLVVNIPTPLWATIILVLLLLTYLKTESTRSSSNLSESKPDYITKQFPIGKYKWEAKIYENNDFTVDKYPFCITHDLRFIFGYNEKYCPHTENSKKCSNRLNKDDEFATYEAAKSIIEKKIRNKDY